MLLMLNPGKAEQDCSGNADYQNNTRLLLGGGAQGTKERRFTGCTKTGKNWLKPYREWVLQVVWMAEGK
ncbi:MAG: hypothetical protein AB4352_22890 [Hormoscilla sp.]